MHDWILSVQENGNGALKVALQQRKKFFLRQAIEHYTSGLDLMCSDDKLNSILYSNRAHANLLLGNFRNAWQDGLFAAKRDRHNIKVCSCMLHPSLPLFACACIMHVRV
jgi:hypothetical protein